MSLFFRSTPYARPHEPPQGGASAALPQKWILVRCCTPSTRHALSTAAVWPPAALRVDPLLQHASQPLSRPTPSGCTASTDAKSDSSLGMLNGTSTLCAPRSDLHHRSGRGAFERLCASSPEVGTGCRDDGRWRRSAAHSRADSKLKTTVCVIV